MSVAILVTAFALVLALAIALSPGPLPDGTKLALGLPLLALAVLDARYYWLPDLLTLPLILIGLMVGVLAGDVSDSLVGLVAWGGIPCALILLLSHFRKQQVMGFGDVKLMAAMGAWLGVDGGAIAIGVAAAGGLAYAALIVAFRLSRRGLRVRIPFGAALALAFWTTALTLPV